MKHLTFLSFIVPSLRNKSNFGSLPFHSTEHYSRFSTLTLSAASSSGGGNESTLRVALGNIFDSRNYLFTTRKNIRGFEWDLQQAEELFEDILEIDQGTENNCLELNLMILMKAEMAEDGKDNKGRDIGPTSCVYDVHDGQQRLVTLSLLVAAIRDEILLKYTDPEKSAEEISQMIYPVKRLKDPVCRIELRESGGNKWLSAILSRMDPETKKSLRDESDCIPDMRTVLPNERSWGKLGLQECEQLILTVYNYFRKRLEDFQEEEIEKLLKLFSENVYVLLCIPTDAKVARYLVMGQGKGKNVEAVDFFKGMVCFNNNDDEKVQDTTLNLWNELCDEVGRNVLEDTCLLLAQCYQKTKVKRNGEISLVEQFLRDWTDPDADSNEQIGKTKLPNEGEVIFKKAIEPAARALDAFRNGIFDVDEIKIKEPPPSLAFLRATASIATCKEIEMVILDLVLKYRTTQDSNLKNAIFAELKRLESIALWMMVVKPKPKERFQRCLDIIEDSNAATLTAEENTQICDALNNVDLGKSANRKKASAILDRLNEHVLVTNYKNRLKPMAAGRNIEHVLPEKHEKVEGWNEIWSETDATDWKQKLGNLALLDGSSNSKIGNKCFEDKKERLSNSPYPLTKDIANNHRWDAATVEKNHKKYIELAKEVWAIKSKY